MRRLLAASLLSILFVPVALLLQPRAAAACSCLPPPGPVEAAQSVHCVFQGRVVSIVDAPKPDKYGLQNKIITFEVMRTFKGELATKVNVVTADNEAACGRNFGSEGAEWLIYARRDDHGQLYDNLCSRSRDMQYADADIAELEEHAHELDDEPDRPEQETPGPADPEPEPILPDFGNSGGNQEPEPTPKPGRCTVDEGTPAGGVFGLVGLGVALLRRRPPAWS